MFILFTYTNRTFHYPSKSYFSRDSKFNEWNAPPNPKHKSSNLTRDIIGNLPSTVRRIDDRAIYLNATLRLNDPKNAESYDQLTYLNKMHNATGNMTKNGDLFYLNTAGHRELALENVV